MVCREGVEPSTIRLKVECSTTELPARTKSDAAGVAAEHSHAECAVNRIARTSVIQLVAGERHGQAGNGQTLQPRAKRAGFGKLVQWTGNDPLVIAAGLIGQHRSEPVKQWPQLHGKVAPCRLSLLGADGGTDGNAISRPAGRCGAGRLQPGR